MSFLGIAGLTSRQFVLYIPSLVVYGITNIIRYQPWELDNTKLFYAAWIPLALPLIANFLYMVGSRRIFFFCHCGNSHGGVLFLIVCTHSGLFGFKIADVWKS
jgi:hypothetical protein